MTQPCPISLSLLSLSKSETPTHKPQIAEWRNHSKTLTLIDIGGHLTHLHRREIYDRPLWSVLNFAWVG